MRRCAEFFGSCVRRTDILARYGEDEFCVLLPSTDLEGARRVALKIWEDFGSCRFLPSLELSVSVGISTYFFGEDKSYKMIKRADQALYRAKLEGGNRVVCWERGQSLLKGSDILIGIFTGDVGQDYRHIRLLLGAISKVNSTMNLDELLRLVVDIIIEITGADRAILMLREGEELVISMAREQGKKSLREVEGFSRTIPHKVLETGQAICVWDTDVQEGLSRSVYSFQLKSIMCVPLRSKGETFGVIYVDSRLERRSFCEKDLAFLEALSQQIAIALVNARLFEENRRRAERLKESLEEIELLNRKLEATNRLLEERLEVQANELEQACVNLRQSQRELQRRFSYHNIIGKSEPMQRLYRLLDRISESDVPVLIYGKSGTGKELVAKAIHFQSRRRDYPIVSENCAAIPEELLQSILFGHVKGAFTGADRDKAGLFEFADGGTLFLDEVGDMSLQMQKKLLRVLEEKKVRRLGSNHAIDVDVRIIAATNKYIPDLVRENRFREDLYYRLNVVEIVLPTLSERREDIPLLVEHFLERYAREEGRSIPRVSPEALRFLVEYNWPGNVRELENEVKRLMVFADEVILPHHLSSHILEKSGSVISSVDFLSCVQELKQARAAFEKSFICSALERNGHNISRTAEKLGISRQHLHRLIETYRIREEWKKK
ncbi:MAG: diguanylate cyclase [Planctomycetota bacterium]|nr:MAG: diguanylate cyclase [Planctomycetota bacterium]